MGLMTSLNGVSGGVEKLYPDEAQEMDIEEIKKTLGPEEGIIERDEEGNVINVIIGRSREEEEEMVFDTEIEPVPAKTDVVKGLSQPLFYILRIIKFLKTDSKYLFKLSFGSSSFKRL